MGTIDLTLPVADTEITAGLHATNYQALETLLNGNLDNSNISAAALLDAVARVGVRKNSAGTTFQRRRINLIEGSGVTLTVADDSGNEEVDVTIASAGGAFIGARASHNTTQSVNSASATPLNLNTEEFDTDTIHDPASNNTRLTAKTAGKYMIGGGFYFSSAPGTDAVTQARIRLNGTTVIAHSEVRAGSTNMGFSLSTIYDLSVNDYVEILALHNAGAARDVTGQQLWMYRIG